MRVLALNGSARGTKGITHRLLAALGRGLAQGGARLETISVSDLEIAPCLACLVCMHKTPGVCAQKDGMDEIYPLLRRADVLVLPHHGSIHPSTARFVEATGARFLIRSGGLHPRPRADRLAALAAGRQFFDTALDGAVHVRLTPDRAAVTRYRRTPLSP